MADETEQIFMFTRYLYTWFVQYFTHFWGY